MDDRQLAFYIELAWASSLFSLPPTTTRTHHTGKDTRAATGEDKLGAMVDYVVHRDGDNKGKKRFSLFPPLSPCP